ncbi:cob(I)yrinic acid a,c-diamide adenosyltransferase [Aestuariimicrobium kwangyangense]|uniref:cob(I)yrinic acid a,c-diamide adenosyltransferase n=1 Tax=Aestuariimicrobium kwangyangense TaxID=396389 RepID=UPI0003B51D01|nr:cob(I)yrinic acid a,c-diamide adenosyltransferase [Aestuariimicrobium kwangyangense]
MVNLTRIYTRTGDAGQTRLSDNSVASKTDLRVAAYGHVDEANSLLGVVLAAADLPEAVAGVLTLIQNELFDVGADLSTPIQQSPPWPPLRIEQESIDRLEAWCDEFSEPLPNLRSFILPSGSPAGAQLHVARTVVRRAERAGWQAAEAHGLETDGGLHVLALTYLNRLSDLLFILSRSVTTESGAHPEREVLWVPGGDRPRPER